MIRRSDFPATLRAQQAAWARDNELGEYLDPRRGRTHVLQFAHRAKNLYDPSWWALIEGKEHRWARSLVSSQCFAVNLFAPLAFDQELAISTYRDLYPNRQLGPSAGVKLLLEFTPTQGPSWLGEKGQPTQVDVCFAVNENGRVSGYSLVEVKLAETEFGSCRGAKPSLPGGNPDPARCNDFSQVWENPEANCWLAGFHGRKYWDLLADRTWFEFSSVAAGEGCPFRGGLYQLMRNAVLAQALLHNTEASWADLATCVHPGNLSAHELKMAVCGTSHVGTAIGRIAPGADIQTLSPTEIISAVERNSNLHADWAFWMRSRYGL